MKNGLLNLRDRFSIFLIALLLLFPRAEICSAQISDLPGSTLYIVTDDGQSPFEEVIVGRGGKFFLMLEFAHFLENTANPSQFFAQIGTKEFAFVSRISNRQIKTREFKLFEDIELGPVPIEIFYRFSAGTISLGKKGSMILDSRPPKSLEGLDTECKNNTLLVSWKKPSPDIVWYSIEERISNLWQPLQNRLQTTNIEIPLVEKDRRFRIKAWDRANQSSTPFEFSIQSGSCLIPSYVKWEDRDDLIRAYGAGTCCTDKTFPDEIRKDKACNVAKARAQKGLLEFITAVHIEAETIIEGNEIKKDMIKKDYQGYLRNARECAKYDWDSEEGVCTYCLGLVDPIVVETKDKQKKEAKIQIH